MRKRTHKLGGLGDVAAVVKASPSLGAAAKKLGIDRSTLYRWIKSGAVSEPDPKRGAPETPETVPAGQSPEEWAATIRSEHRLSRTDLQLLELAVIALTAGRDMSLKSKDRMTAIGRFQLVVRQLNLPESEEKPAEAGRPSRQVVKPVAHREDPRVAFLRAVK